MPSQNHNSNSIKCPTSVDRNPKLRRYQGARPLKASVKFQASASMTRSLARRGQRELAGRLKNTGDFSRAGRQGDSWLVVFANALVAQVDSLTEKSQGYEITDNNTSVGRRELYFCSSDRRLIGYTEETDSGTRYFVRSYGERLGEVLATEVLLRNDGSLRVATNAEEAAFN